MFHPDSCLIRFLARLCDLLLLNIALVLSCCTVVLSGTAVTALYSMTLKLMRGRTATQSKGFSGRCGKIFCRRPSPPFCSLRM